MMLDHLGEAELSNALLKAIESVMAKQRFARPISAESLRQDRSGKRSSAPCRSRERRPQSPPV